MPWEAIIFLWAGIGLILAFVVIIVALSVIVYTALRMLFEKDI